jgi:hypothetical protein
MDKSASFASSASSSFDHSLIGPPGRKKLFEDLLDNRYFILKTDHKNLTYINVTFTGKVLRWKLYLQDKDFDLFHVPGMEEHQFVPDALSRLCTNHVPPPPTLADRRIVPYS